MTASTYLDRAASEFRRRLDDLGVAESDSDPEALGRMAALAAAAEIAWEGALGPLLTSAEARTLLGGLSREGLRRQVRAGRVLALRDEGGRVRYPAWQFDPNEGRSRSLVADLIELFRAADLSDWTIAAFCVSGQPELAGKAPVGAWRGEGSRESIVQAARRAVHELTR